ncbi:putative tricarboxylic transport membrane protein [Spinactinospora alkalitolerans]|uniref:Putative tricarboxylic transport membrane protein n=1 Tax=Spinactinospora alkalitolerans TaxID=687207 RepID=A0A852TUQ2_9ACTN|nr:tripartite tricarboxylate transporter permease [Spinactinospora alkalitolerans]NYE47668.1 putative tricarboxylic transport membrane protein [Spinactinospora alkalitolerans]
MSPIVEGFSALLDPTVALCVLAGAVLGMLVGAFPGLTATMAVALASGFTLALDPIPGLAVLLTIYVSANFGDRVPAILVNTPGTPASIATTFDGYAMAKQGRAGLALTSSAFASAIGTVVGVVLLMVAAIPLSRLALQFGPAEMFALVVFGLTMMIGVSGGRITKGLMAGVLGLLLGAVGRDPITGAARFTFGIPELSEGVPFIAAIIGLFGIAEVFEQVLTHRPSKVKPITQFGKWFPTREDWREMGKPLVIGGGVGSVVGAVPATGGDIAGIIAWDQARRRSKRPERFGKGSLEGITAADTSSNATLGGSLTTTLSLGIPGDSVMAVMIGSMVIWGIQPGPSLFTGSPELVYSIAGLMLVATVLTLGISLLRMRGVVKLLELPPHFLWAVVLVFCMVGTYAVNNNVFDVGVMLVFGLVGLFLRRFGVPPGPIVLGLLLGELAEGNLRRALEIGGVGNIATSPIAVAILTVSVLALVVPPLREGLRRRRSARAADTETARSGEHVG